MPRPTLFTLSLAALMIFSATPAHAYLDAGTGSMMLQAIVGAVATALMFGRLYLARMKSFFVRGRSAKAEQNGRMG